MCVCVCVCECVCVCVCVFRRFFVTKNATHTHMHSYLAGNSALAGKVLQRDLVARLLVGSKRAAVKLLSCCEQRTPQ